MPGKVSDASFMTASISASLRMVKPCNISSRNVPPGGSILGLVHVSRLLREALWKARSTVCDRLQSSFFYRDLHMRIPCRQLQLPSEARSPRSSTKLKRACQAVLFVSICRCIGRGSHSTYRQKIVYVDPNFRLLGT